MLVDKPPPSEEVVKQLLNYLVNSPHNIKTETVDIPAQLKLVSVSATMPKRLLLNSLSNRNITTNKGRSYLPFSLLLRCKLDNFWYNYIDKEKSLKPGTETSQSKHRK